MLLWLVVHAPRTRFLDGGQLFNLDFKSFLHLFSTILTAFRAYKIYGTHSSL